MPPKRKSDAIDPVSEESAFTSSGANAPAQKKVRKADASSSVEGAKPTRWQDVVVDGEDEDEVAIYDDCNEIRRKIRLLQKEPNFKITHWLKDIGNINSNSFGRFMKAKGPTGGAENGTYEAAYLYFEKRRILEGKKKTKKREDNEARLGYGFSRSDMSNRKVWVITGR